MDNSPSIDEPWGIEKVRLTSLSGDYPAALDQLKVRLASHPEDIQALILLGNTLELQAYSSSRQAELSFKNCTQLGEAKFCYDRVLSLQPNNLDAMTDLANLFKEAGQYESCLALLKEAQLLLLTDGNEERLKELADEIREVSARL